jgi:hypothetical protein
MIPSQEQETLKEKKSPELQRELESVYVPGKWWYKLLRKIGQFFGLE